MRTQKMEDEKDCGCINPKLCDHGFVAARTEAREDIPAPSVAPDKSNLSQTQKAE